MHARSILIALLFAFAACSCDPACPTGAEMIDGRCRYIVDANATDASVDDASMTDASTRPDAEHDGGMMDAPPAPEPARVRIRYSNGNFAPGIATVFHAQDGAVLDTVTTDDSGWAESRVPGIDVITAIIPELGDLGRHLYTVVGIGPGQTTMLVLEELTVERIALPPLPSTASFSVISDGYQVARWASNAGGQSYAALPISEPGAVTVFALASSGLAVAYTEALAFGQSDTIRELPAWNTSFETHSYLISGADPASDVYAEIYGDYDGRDVLIGTGVADTLHVAPGFPGRLRPGTSPRRPIAIRSRSLSSRISSPASDRPRTPGSTFCSSSPITTTPPTTTRFKPSRSPEGAQVHSEALTTSTTPSITRPLWA